MFITKRFLSSNLHPFRKKLLYRSKQRGWLEVDIILGSWASDNLMNLNNNQLVNYEKILNKDTTDIFDFIIGSKLIPNDLDKDLVNNIKEYSYKIDFSKVKEKLPN